MVARTRALVLATLLLAAGPVHAALTAQVDRAAVRADEPVVLRVESDDGDAQPDFSALQRDFRVQASQASSSLRIVDGRVERRTTWLLQLLPRRSGTLLIPALASGGARTRPIEVRVGGVATPPALRAGRSVFFEIRVAPERRYVQSQVSYTRRLYYAPDAQIFGDLPDLPVIPGAIVQPLAAPAPDSARIAGVDYGVVEQRFAIFPQHSGTLVIPSVSVEAVLPRADGRVDRGPVAAPATRVDVLPVPANYPAGIDWLPARRLALAERWVLPARLEAGQAIVREVSLEAEGLSMSALPDLRWRAVAGARAYARPPRTNESTDGAYITGTRTQRFTWVPTQPGTLTLPGQDITWFDVQAQAVRHAVLPPRSLHIGGAALARVPSATQPAVSARLPAPNGNGKDNSNDSGSGSGSGAIQRPLVQWLGIGVAALLLAWLLLRGARALPRLRAARRARAAAPTLPTAAAAAAARALRALALACRQGDVRAAQRAFTEWLALQAPPPPWCDDAPVRDLRARAFGAGGAAGAPGVQGRWHGEAFLRWLHMRGVATGRFPPAPGTSADDAALPPLYPASEVRPAPAPPGPS